MRSRGENSEKKKTEGGQIVELFGLPRDLFQGLPLLSLAGNRALCITNHRGIRRYTSEQIVVAARPFAIEIRGKELCIPSFSGEQLEVTGIMEGIAFVP